MPDVASHAQAQVGGRLDWVGMNTIEMPVLLDATDGRHVQTTARISAFVDLERPEKRGIHMSRLYLHLDQALAGHTVTPALLRHLLRDFLASHEDLSSKAMLRLDFDYMLRRKSLVSDNSGWKRYPISIIASLNEREFGIEMAFQIAYSSTCPCSAALSRQLIQERFLETFGDRNSVTVDDVTNWLGTQRAIAALPHSQRSHADATVRLADGVDDYPIDPLIDECERALGTAVQSVVKRADEQEFARLNAEQLMFCEDAARLLARALDNETAFVDYRVRVQHLESLHPHDAVAVVTKGVAGGFSA